MPPVTLLITLFLLCVLPSCTTTVLWGARDTSMDAQTFAAKAAVFTTVAGGQLRIGVELEGPLPEGCAPALPRGGKGMWLVAELGDNQALAEVTRVAAVTGARAECLVSLYQDDEVLVDVTLDLQPEQTPAVRLVHRLRFGSDRKLETQAKGTKATIVAEPPPGGELIAAPRLRWWKPGSNEPRHSLMKRVIYTPFTLLLDVVAMPVVPLGIVYGRAFTGLGGRL